MTTHVYLVIDESGSMQSLAAQAQRVAQGWLNAMTGDPGTLANLAYFAYKPRWVIERRPGSSTVPPLRPDGQTALRDAIHEAAQRAQLELNMDPDASALLLVVTDGGENHSRVRTGECEAAVRVLRATGRADFGLMVPPGQRETARRLCGLDTEDVREWETTAEGLRRADELVQRSVRAYSAARSAGTRSVGRFFVDVAGANVAAVRAAAAPISPTKIREFPVHAKARIDEFATSRTGNYVVGEWYYQLTKPETVQPHKRLLLDDGGTWYEGPAVREVLGLGGAVGDVKVAPAGLSAGRRVFVQSTSTTRNLSPGQSAVRVAP
jgi:hypothetical protein